MLNYLPTSKAPYYYWWYEVFQWRNVPKTEAGLGLGGGDFDSALFTFPIWFLVFARGHSIWLIHGQVSKLQKRTS